MLQDRTSSSKFASGPMSERAKRSASTTRVCTLTPKLLYTAYSQGYFPMPDEESGEISWYRPDPRAIIPLDGFHVSRSLRRTMRRKTFTITYGQAFEQVMDACSDHEVSWINEEIKASYQKMFRLQVAQSVEVWLEGRLVGGVYGLNFGGVFFAESMFHRETDASKVALYYLTQHLRKRGFDLLEVQFMTDHLASLGAVEILDYDYMPLMRKSIAKDIYFSREFCV